MPNTLLKDVVDISPAWSTEVELRRDYRNKAENSQKLRGYVPNSASRKALAGICEGLRPNSRQRAHLVTGPRGTGKSHFALVLANFLRRDLDAPDLKPLFDKLSADSHACDQIRHARASVKPYLIAIPDPAGDPEGFDHALLVALKEALDIEGLDFRPPSNFRAAVDTVRNWQTQHEEAFRKLEAELARHGTNVEMMIEKLERYSPDAYRVFQEAHTAVAYGTEFRPEFSCDPIKVYGETAKFLRDQGDWQGIFVICDEFGCYLSQIAKDPNAVESGRVLGFLEFCKRSEQDQVHIVAVAHQSFEAYAGGQKARQEFEKLHGRLLDSEYYIKAVSDNYEMEQMTDSIIVQQVDGDGWKSVCGHPDLQILVDQVMSRGLYSGKNREWVENTIVKGCFPMHPIAMFCLPWLADRVGQESRSLFCFFGARGDGGLSGFVENHDTTDSRNRLELYTADGLATYFDSGIRASEEYRRIATAMDEALRQCRSVELAERAVRTIGVLEIVGHGMLPATRDVIAHALWLSVSETTELERTLNELAERGAIRYRKASQEYSLQHVAAGVEVEEEINKEMQTSADSLDLADVLNQRPTSNRPTPTEYNDKHFTNREAWCRFARTAQLSNTSGFTRHLAPGKDASDACVLYVLPETDDEIEDARGYLQQEENQHRQLIVALPKSPVSFRQLAVRMKAIENLYAREPFCQSGSAEREELDHAKRDTNELLRAQEKTFLTPSGFVWHNMGNSTADVADLGAYLSGIMESVFPKTPPIRDKDINHFGGRDNSRTHRQHALDRVLGTTGTFQIKKDAGPAEDRILRSCLKDTELLELRNDKGAFQEFSVRGKPPENSVLAEVWKLLSDRIVGDRNEDKCVFAADVVNALLNPPYGMPPQAIEVVLGAFLATVSDECALMDGVRNLQKTGSQDTLRQCTLSGEAIYTLVRDPEDWVIYYYLATKGDKGYIRRVRSLFPEEEQGIDNVGLWESGKRALLTWFGELPRIAKAAQNFGNPQSCDLVSLLSDHERTSDPKKLLKEALPAAMSIGPADDGQLPYDEVVEKLKDAVEDLSNFAAGFETVLTRKLCIVFAAKGETQPDLSAAVTAWYNGLPADTKLHSFAGNERHLIDASRSEGPIVQRMLKTMPEAMGLGAYPDWEADRTNEFVAKLELAKHRIDGHKDTQPAPSKPQPTDTQENERVLQAAEAVRAALSDLGLTLEEKRAVFRMLSDELEQ